MAAAAAAGAAAAAAGSSDQQGRSDCHVPTFSARHPLIPKLYVMPWKQDMKNRRLLMKNAALVRIPVDALEESLCLCGRERLCHRQDSSHGVTPSSSSSSSSAALSQAALPAHHSSHFSRYNSSVITAQYLFQP